MCRPTISITVDYRIKQKCLWQFQLEVDYYSHKISKVRSSHPEVFCKKGVLRNFAKFTGKHLCQSLFFNKVAKFIYY